MFHSLDLIPVQSLRTRLCGLTENSFTFQGQAAISQTHSLNSYNQNFNSSIYSGKSLSLEIEYSKTTDQKSLSLSR